MNQLKLNVILSRFPIRQVKADLYAQILEKEFVANGITGDDKQLQFIANALAETGNFESLVESLNYSAERIPAVWSFVSPTLAQQLAHDPEKLANYVYDSRVRKNTMGNNSDGDGWKYRGRGLLQTTWKANYQTLANKTGLDVVNHPELLEQPEIAVKSAAIFWRVGNLSAKPNLLEVRKAIAGGSFGYKEVQANFDNLISIYNKMI